MSKWMIANKKADFEKIAGEFGIRDITARLIANTVSLKMRHAEIDRLITLIEENL